MRVIVNGEHRDVAASTIAALLTELDYAGNHFAIALNLDVVPRGNWPDARINDGDDIEIITPRQGG